MTPNDAAQLAKIANAIEIVRAHKARGDWSEEYGDAHQFLMKILEPDLREWIKTHPPETTGYGAGEPRRAIYIYSDSLIPEINNDVIKSLLFSSSYFEEVAKRTIASLKTKSVKSERDVIARRYPEYLALLKQIREAKASWNTEDKAIKQTAFFRVAGGLARLGSRSGIEYEHLVNRAQSMERTVLGKTLTKHTRPSR